MVLASGRGLGVMVFASMRLGGRRLGGRRLGYFSRIPAISSHALPAEDC